MPSPKRKISFIGSGIIAGALIERLLKTGFTTPDQILGTDTRPERLAELKGQFGIQVSGDNADAVRFGDVVFIAVPPNAVQKVVSELRNELRGDQLIISLAAAVPAVSIEEAIGRPLAVVRVIPNTPSLVGAGMNPYCLGTHVQPEHIAVLDELLAVFGETIRVEEGLMNISTALTAVGPTYVFPVIKALTEAAVRQGLSAAEAQSAAAQTVLGAARLVLETKKTPDELKLMIGTRTINEESAISVFAEAVGLALTKINQSQEKIATARGVSATA